MDVISHFLAPAPGPAQLTVNLSTGNMQESHIPYFPFSGSKYLDQELPDGLSQSTVLIFLILFRIDVEELNRWFGLQMYLTFNVFIMKLDSNNR